MADVLNLKSRIDQSALDEALNTILASKERRDQIASATADGRKRLFAVGRKINEARNGCAIDPEVAADALRTGELMPVVSIETLLGEKSAIEAGLRELTKEYETEGRIQAQAKGDAIAIIRNAVAPAIAPLAEMARHGAEQIAVAYAAAAAIGQATGSADAKRLELALREIVAVAELSRQIEGRTIAVHPDVTSMLATAAEAIAVIGRSIPERVGVPNKAIDPGLLAVMSAAS